MSKTKVCSKCGIEKPLVGGFNVARARKDGYSYRCKDCGQEKNRKYLTAEYQRRYREANPEKVKAYYEARKARAKQGKSTKRKATTPAAAKPKNVDPEMSTIRPDHIPMKPTLLAFKEETFELLEDCIKSLSPFDQKMITYLLEGKNHRRSKAGQIEFQNNQASALIRLKDEFRRRGIQSFNDLPL